MTGVLDTLSKESQDLLRKRSQPRWTAPMLATLHEKHFSDPNWIFERKLDGVRCLVFRDGSDIRLMSRNEKNMSRTFPELIGSIQGQACDDFIVDGEIVAFEGQATSFGALQKRLGVLDSERARKRNVPVFLYLFDVLHVDGHDLTAVPLLERKKVLKQIIDFRAGQSIRYSKHRRERGEKFLREACRDGWEGLIAKRDDSPYHHGRSRDWLKLKCISEQEFVVVGFTDPQQSRTGFGALLVGYYDKKGDLHYAGKVGTGYDEQTLRILGEHMKQIERDEPPFVDDNLSRDRSVRGAHWIRPNLVAQIAFTEWTRDGRLRQPRFLGLRDDKPPKKVVRELPNVLEGDERNRGIDEH